MYFIAIIQHFKIFSFKSLAKVHLLIVDLQAAALPTYALSSVEQRGWNLRCSHVAK